ncbi:PLP-dependent aminotransferase family protein [Solirubrobacter sp. CPCC 204708]|uniref:PLP-dependent aminotransferase family protein n=1 Tax=Solirubrobacter deserti TaxID=2282478 RepID=A0ABT4RE49_9ACTN|nr:PLP-dependent aminotransferase family protein [Solirubrobacter deserti]MBE2316057.1 PLP-dependent aminotransferase family protein [Solirubrobacter deserti]MDA0136809.1 PLP-dependent aminotransferase family protein [Solirubrobacter deserti]
MDVSQLFSQRARAGVDPELAIILAGPPPGTLGMTGGFPNADAFPQEELTEITARLVRDEPGLALQYTASAGIPSFREYLVERTARLQGREPAYEELMVTSGGMECLDLLCRSLLDGGDPVAVEGPTYLGAIMAFRDYGAQVHGVPMDGDGLEVDWLRERLDRGFRPKFLYTIPEFQNPSGRTLSLERRRALIELCRAYGVLIVEDVAYRELSFDGSSLPSLWSLGPDVVVQAGTFSKIFCPGTRLGWAIGPAPLIAQLSSAKGGTDQCAGALGQRMVEEYGRAGLFGKRLPHARALYESHWVALSAALCRHMPEGVAWSEPTGGMFTWLRMPEGLDARSLRPAATEAGVAYVPGAPFYVDGGGANEMRLSFSSLDERSLAVAAERLAGVIEEALSSSATAATAPR